jgi:hypothetical protein
MTVSKRPLSVTVLAVLYIATGAVGFVYHLYAIVAARTLPGDLAAAEITELAAVVSGAFILRGARWAQWFALAWSAFHLAVSLSSLQRAIVHGILLAVVAVCLFHSEARAYFQPKTQITA